uniref:F-box domain-containing protein n=1 Tax=Cannabis sativa TaxID=3483 RepID=A0A803NXI4_CANSA
MARNKGDFRQTQKKKKDGKLVRIDDGGGASMDGICDDLLLEILLRLSDQRLAIQCSVVCKRWRMLIWSPQFVGAFKGKRPTTLVMQVGECMRIMLCGRKYCRPTDNVVYQKQLSSFTSYLNFIPEDGLMNIKACFNDLLLVERFRDERRKLYICNPFTRQWFLLPNLNLNPVSYYGEKFGLSCEEVPDSGNKLLFKYRVSIVYDHIKVANFRWKTRKWSRSYIGEGLSPLDGTDNLVSLNGNFYCIMTCSKTKTIIVVVFDPGRNKFVGRIELPKTDRFPPYVSTPPLDLSYPKFSLGVSEGRLRLAMVRPANPEKEEEEEQNYMWKVWENNNGSWSLVYNRACFPTWQDKPQIIYPDKIWFHPENGEVMFSISEIFQRVLCHNMREGTVEEILEILKRYDIVNFRGRSENQITSIQVTLSATGLPPFPFHLTRLIPPTPAPN